MTKDIGVIPAPEHRSPGAPIGVTEIGTVTNLDGTEATVLADGNLVIVNGPLAVLGDQFVLLLGYLAKAGWKAAVNEGQSAMDDGGAP